MKKIADVTFEILRRNGLNLIFGNPGSNELPFLAAMPRDFRYILGLSENVVLGMAEGYAQASGRAAFVNLHAAAGTGNAMGALTNAWAAHSPLVITAGQQVRSTIGMEVMLSNVEAAILPKPLVKWSNEPADPTDVPRAISQAIHMASLDPKGPVYVSIPYDDWGKDAGVVSDHLADRVVTHAGHFSAEQLEQLTAAIARAENPVLVLGPDVDSANANEDAVALAERLRAPVWVAPSAPRCPFPTRHAHFRGILPASVSGIAQRLADHDLVIVIGAPVFRYHQHDPGEYLAENTALIHLTCDPSEAARAPMGNAWVVDIRLAIQALATALPQSQRVEPIAISRAAPPAVENAPFPPSAVFNAINALAPDDAVFVNEATSTVTEMWEHLNITKSGSYFFPAAGGLGYGIPAALGIQLADSERRVIAVIGDGSANFSLPGLWTAVQENIPVIFIILNNGTYGALRGFATKLDAEGVPGIDIPGIDFCALANGYGMTDAYRVETIDELKSRFSAALRSDGPTLIEVPIETISPF